MTETTPKGHPRGLYVLFVTEMWERFSYYGMRAIFILFLTKALLYDKAAAANIYGSYTGLVYLTPLLGGYVADRYWGNRKSILFGGAVMALGQFLMFLSGSFYENTDLARMIMLGGLTFLIIGNGFFKPNISTMVGQHYAQGDKRVDSAFTIFYMGINLGAFFSPIICGTLGDTGDPADFKWGFLAACIGMVASLIIFVWLKDRFLVTPEGGPIGAVPNKNRETADVDTAQEAKKAFEPVQFMTWGTVLVASFALFFWVLNVDLIGSFIFSLSLAVPGLIISDRTLSKVERERIWVIYIAAFFVIFFWAAFEQAGASLTFFAEEQTNRNLFGWLVPASLFQSVNAVAIVIFAPLFAALWSTLSKRNREPASPYKQAYGLALLSLGYLVIAIGVKALVPGEKSNMMWLLALYLIHTFGELCLSPIGLSMVNKLAPIKFASLLMGVWFLSTAAANKFAGTLSALYPEDVKMEQEYVAKSFSYLVTAAHDSVPEQKMNVANDSAFIVNTFKEPTATLAASFDVKPGEPGQDSVVMLKAGQPTWDFVADSVKNEKGEKEMHIKQITNNFASNTFQIPMYKLKQIIHLSEVKEISDDAAEQKKIDGKWLARTDERRVNYTFTSDGKSIAVWGKGGVSIWNISPKKPSFAGFEISNLYNFFMLFVIMSGLAAVCLFFLSKKMVKMMNGIL